MHLTPEVTELMARIREERRLHLNNGGSLPPEPSLELPTPAAPLPPLPLAPVAALAVRGAAKPPAWAVVTDMVARARQKIIVNTRLPGWLRPMSRNQGGFNGILLEAVDQLGQANAQLQGQIETLSSGLEAQGEWLATLARASAADREWMLAAGPCLLQGVTESGAHRRRAELGEARLLQLEELQTQTRIDLDQLNTRAGHAEMHASGLGEHLNDLQRHCDVQTAHVEKMSEHLAKLQGHANRHDAHFEDIYTHVDRLGQRLDQASEGIQHLQHQADEQADRLQEAAVHLGSLQEYADRQNARNDQVDGYVSALQRHADSQNTRNEQVQDHLGSLQHHANSQNTHNDHVDGYLGSLQRHADGQNARNEQVQDHLGSLQRHADNQNTHNDHVDGYLGSLQRHADGQNARNEQVQDHLGSLQRHADNQNTRNDQTDGHLSSLQGQADAQNTHLHDVHGHMDRLGQHLEQRLDQAGTLLNSLQSDTDEQTRRLHDAAAHLASLQGHANLQNAHNDQVDGHLSRLQMHADSQNAQHIQTALGEWLREDLGRLDARHARLEAVTAQLDERQVADASYLKSQFSLFGNLFQRLLSPHDVHGGGFSAILPARLEEVAGQHGQHELDAFYLAFENRFRGSREEIKERMRVHLLPLEHARVGSGAAPVLDLGCGRGEWLELLRENGFAATGVDLNESMIEQCRERGLEVTAANVIDFLRDLPEASRGAVTAFHLIEHLPFQVLFHFVQECLRVLQPGGVAIFETPNPENIVVGASEFWFDYTHQRPLPPGAAQFLVEQVGFAEARIVPLHPVPEELRPRPGVDPALPERVYSLFYGARDYALVATKACTS